METATLTFILKDVKSEGKTLIFCVIRLGESRLKYSTGEKIRPGQWDLSARRAIVGGNREQREDLKTINQQLNRYEKVFNQTSANLKTLEKYPTLTHFRAEFDKIFKKNPGQDASRPDLFPFIEEFIKTSDRAENTKKHYTTTLNLLKDFQEHRRRKIRYETIDLDFYNELVSYMQDPKGKNFTKNTIGTQIKNLKVFMNQSFERGLHENREYQKKDFRITEEESDSIYLTRDEVEKIYKKDLSENQKLDRVRDLFIIACWTGLRFSDLRQIAPDNIIKDENVRYLRITTQKTGERVQIPLNWMILEILKKYKNELPRVISNQKFNEYLKEIGELSGIKTTVQLSSTKGGMKYPESFKKYELITVHTARRTFATLAYLADIPTISIMKITGHRTERAFLKYIKISQEDNAKKLSGHTFFSQMRLVK